LNGEKIGLFTRVEFKRFVVITYLFEGHSRIEYSEVFAAGKQSYYEHFWTRTELVGLYGRRDRNLQNRKSGSFGQT